MNIELHSCTACVVLGVGREGCVNCFYLLDYIYVMERSGQRTGHRQRSQ